MEKNYMGLNFFFISYNFCILLCYNDFFENEETVIDSCSGDAVFLNDREQAPVTHLL